VYSLISPVSECELDEVKGFLCGVFGVKETYAMFQPEVLRWKCLAPHPFWSGSRGYALRYKGELAAFGCLAPCRFLTGSATVASCCTIDWAASQKVPGAGVMLYRHIQSLTGAMINIGGSNDARRVLPRMGFQERLALESYTRVLRPLRQWRQTPRDWKSPLRWARDCRELLRPAQGAPGGWRARRITSFDQLAPDLFPDPAVTRAVVCERTAESLNYSLACPAARMEAYVLDRDGAPCGYFLLSRSGYQCRIADLWVRSEDGRHWAAAYAAATAAAGLEATQVTAAASTALPCGALRQAGYRRTQGEPVFVLDPGGLLGGRSDLAIGLLENDGYYWRGEV
jgi:hypothetical protein